MNKINNFGIWDEFKYIYKSAGLIKTIKFFYTYHVKYLIRKYLVRFIFDVPKEYIVNTYENIKLNIRHIIFKMKNKEFNKMNKEYVNILKRANDRKNK
jgi:hypothetical protein